MHVKIILFLLDFVLIVLAVKTYMNYLNIKTTIDSVHNQYETEIQKVDFYKNFFLNYENSEYSRYFLQHENSMLGPSEYVIKFENMPEKGVKSDEGGQDKEEDNTLKTPPKSWKSFFSEKLSGK